MVNLTLMRHSVSIANEEGICDSGRHDAALSENGENLARFCAETVTDCPDAIYTSDMKRARGTAEIYARILKENFGREVPVIVLGKLRAQDEGILEGLSYNSPEYKILRHAREVGEIGGESSDAASHRQITAFSEIIKSAVRAGYGNVLVVTHADVILRFLCATGHLPSGDFELPKNCQQLGPFSGDDTLRKISLLLTPRLQSPPPKPPGLG